MPWINYLGCESFFRLISNTGGGFQHIHVVRLGEYHPFRVRFRHIGERAQEFIIVPHHLTQMVGVALPVGDRLARHARVDSGFRHGARYTGQQTGIERFRKDIVASESGSFQLIGGVHHVGNRFLGKVGDSVDGGQLHLLVDRLGVRVQGAAEDIREYVQILLENGKAYIAFDTPEELDAKRAEIANFQYDASTRGMMRNSLTMPKEEVDALIAEGKQYVVRFKIEPNEDIHVNDLIRGEVVINSSILDDKVLYKSADELPTYHLANIVDDHLMEVSHVIRGEEWLPSAPLHVLLYRAFGWEDTMPEFAHLPLLLKPEGNGKLSKRDGDRLGFPVFPLEWHDPKSGEISSGYRESGYLPEAVINFLALLGWNPGNDQEVMSMDELIKLFDLHRCSKSGAKFDYKKGIWFNHQYIQQKPNEEIAELFLPFLKEQGVEAPFEKVVTVVGMMKDRVSFIKELWDVCSFFFVAPTEYDEKTVKKRWKEDSAKCMTELAEVIAGIEDFSIEGQEKVVMDWIAEKGYHTGNIMNAFRLTLVGEGKGPHMFDISWVLGKEETIARMKRAVEVLK